MGFIEFVKFIPGIKATFEFFKYKEEELLIDSAWLEGSDIQKSTFDSGYKLSWSNPDKVQSKIKAGAEIVYDCHWIKRVRRKYVNKSGQVLIRQKTPIHP